MGSAVAGAGDSCGCRRRSDYTDLTAALSLLKRESFIIFFLIFALSWIKPLNVNITVALDGEVREQFTKLYIYEYEDSNASK